ncbi:MAG: type I DNA topoisomerase [Deltaproteobacteria bacterium HGW-Deltaproteobacteria-14]|jgi:DNA topoisomerase-1|nr:MAG: type I DNA topoisomerase [Deltaproteobacteria bacterium HGW-Deltaproteobacteria-14]
MAEKALVVVESPAKAKTIKKYLGAGFEVKASVGHVKDLPKSKMGVRVEDGFEPEYETIRGKGKVLQEIRKAAKDADIIYLAPDPDREGEAIAWHIFSELKVPAEKVRRVMFHEITKNGVLSALQQPTDLNVNRFNSQQARRILDRLVGYNISPLLWDKVRRGLSAGRVQSVAVRVIVEREREIAAFVPVEYWTVDGVFKGPNPPPFKAKLFRIDQKKAELTHEGEASAALAAVRPGPFRVAEVKERDRQQQPPAPFTTSRLQQDAARAFRFTAKRTMNVAQRLYEGVELGEAGSVGLITYMRTDSTRLSDDAVSAVREYIGKKYGPNYLPESVRVFKTKGRAQDAHEAVRPTSLEFPPSRVKQYLEPDAFKLYTLIWNRFVGCQMAAAIHASTTVDIEAPAGHLFRATGSVVKFDGFTAVYQETRSEDAEEGDEDSGSLPRLAVGDELEATSVDGKQHFTQPPPRFTEATLVRELEEKGIGRPSTYASIISTIQTKEYAEKVETRFRPTELGTIVVELLVESFPQLFDVGFTARMEDQLDEIEDGRVDWKALLGEFWGGLEVTLEAAKTEMRNVKREETPTDIPCPKDGSLLVIKFGKNGSFLACSNYPDCRFTGEFVRKDDGTIELVQDELVGERCPECAEGELIFKKGKFGRFIGCTQYPTCRFTRAISTGVTCPKCSEGQLIEKRSKRGKVFYSCSRYPKCDHAQWDKPLPIPCPTCEHPFIEQKMTRKGPGAITCPSCGSEFPDEILKKVS